MSTTERKKAEGRERIAKQREAFLRLPLEQQEMVIQAWGKRDKIAEDIRLFLNALPDNPCPTCLSTCCSYTHSPSRQQAHPGLFLAKESLLESFVAPHDPEAFPVASPLRGGEHCIFLKGGYGCTLPDKYRSDVCLYHACSPLNRVLEHYGRHKDFKVLVEKLRKSLSIPKAINRLLDLEGKAFELEQERTELFAKLEHGKRSNAAKKGWVTRRKNQG